MSGGQWEYVGQRIMYDLALIAETSDVVERWPEVARAIEGLGDAIYEIEHDADWDLSADRPIEDDGEWQAEAVGRLLAAVLGDTSPSCRARIEDLGSHRHVTLYTGPDAWNRSHAGSLVVRVEHLRPVPEPCREDAS